MVRDLRGASVELLPFSQENGSSPESYNMGGCNSHRMSSGSEDTIVLGLFIGWGSVYRDVMNTLQKAQLMAREEDEGRFIKRGDILYCVEAAGTGRGRSYKRYVINVCGMRLEIAEREDTSGETPNAQVVVGSMCASMHTPTELMMLIKQVVAALGGEVLHNKLSRIDGCLDLPGVEIDEFVQAYVSGRVVTRARKGAIYFGSGGKRPESLYVGRGDCVLRIYDKVTEVLTKAEPEKLQFMVNERWGGKVPESATRVEFQIRRKMLKQFEDEKGERIETYEDYIRCRSALWEYFTTSWVRFTESEVDSTHTTRAKVSELWQAVVGGFASWTKGSIKRLTRKYRIKQPGMALVSQAIGCLVKVVANTARDAEEFLKSSYRVMEHELQRLKAIGSDRFDRKMESAALYYDSYELPEVRANTWKYGGATYSEWERLIERDKLRMRDMPGQRLLF